jgi:MRG-binding protein
LETLYDLGILDEREDARQLEAVKIPNAFRGDDSESEAENEGGEENDDADAYSEAANKIENDEFSLPGDEFAERKWIQRLPTERQRRDESPPLLPELNMADEAPMRFTPSFSIEPSEVATPTSRKGRAKVGRPTAKATTTRRSTRQAESVADEDGDEEDAEAEEEEEESSEEEDQSEKSTPARRGARNAKGARGRTDQKASTRSRARAK